MYWNTTSNTETCPYAYRKGPSPNKFASPEEYRNAHRTEKLDVYSMGNVLYFLLTGDDPFDDLEKEEAVALLRRGKKAKIRAELRTSKDPIDRTLIGAVEMCFVREWKDRHTSTDVLNFLLEAKENIQMEKDQQQQQSQLQ